MNGAELCPKGYEAVTITDPFQMKTGDLFVDRQQDGTLSVRRTTCDPMTPDCPGCAYAMGAATTRGFVFRKKAQPKQPTFEQRKSAIMDRWKGYCNGPQSIDAIQAVSDVKELCDMVDIRQKDMIDRARSTARQEAMVTEDIERGLSQQVEAMIQKARKADEDRLGEWRNAPRVLLEWPEGVTMETAMLFIQAAREYLDRMTQVERMMSVTPGFEMRHDFQVARKERNAALERLMDLKSFIDEKAGMNQP